MAADFPPGQWLHPGDYQRERAYPGSPTVDAVLPVYNEEHILAASVDRLRRFLAENADFAWRIVIADNASTDGTLDEARRLAAQHADVAAMHLPQKGRGRALHAAWGESNADVRTYMDIDLSTGLPAYLDLVRAISLEGYDVATGSRLHRSSAVSRSARRDFISQTYNVIIQLGFGTRFSDAQCGFKAISAKAARQLLPLIEDGEWFFDTELLILAEKNGLRIKDVPITWIEDPDTRVNVRKTVMQDLRGLARLRRHLPRIDEPNSLSEPPRSG